MNSYPRVKDEFETLVAVLGGKSIARLGDGEFRLLLGGKSKSQINDPKLAAELRAILNSRSKRCIVGIPRMVRESPKYWFWKRYERVYPKLLQDGKVYYSTNFTRTDSSPWCDTPEYFDKIESLWKDQEVVVVCGSDRSLSASSMRSAKRVEQIICPYRDAYAEIDRIERDVMATGLNRAILCAGATATVLAHRLAERGLHALDLGHIGFMPRALKWKAAP